MTMEGQLAHVMNQDKKGFTGPSSYLTGVCTDVPDGYQFGGQSLNDLKAESVWAY